jgi:hypothetical protein
MVLRFEVDQAEAFRQGVNVETSTNHLRVNPAELSQEERNLIADRLDGIDVCKLELGVDGKATRAGLWPEEEANGPEQKKTNMKARIKAKLPTYESLIEAIRENQAEIEKESPKGKPSSAIKNKSLNDRRASALDTFLNS